MLVGAPQAPAQDKAKAFCENKWPGNYSMQEYCLDRQIEANNSVIKWARRKGILSEEGKITGSGDYTQILQHCLSKWTAEPGGYNWAMVDYCIGRQSESYERLN